MSIFESIIAQFNGHIDTTSGNIEFLIPLLAEATHLFTAALLSDKKIICCTSANNFSAGNQFCHYLLNGNEWPRPGLPAIFLGGNCSTILSMAEQPSNTDVFSGQIHALGQSGDILFLIASHGPTESLAAAIDAAHAKDIPVVALLSSQHSDLVSKAGHTDIVISVQAETLQQTQLLNYLISVILASQIEQQLFGSMAP